MKTKQGKTLCDSATETKIFLKQNPQISLRAICKQMEVEYDVFIRWLQGHDPVAGHEDILTVLLALIPYGHTVHIKSKYDLYNSQAARLRKMEDLKLLAIISKNQPITKKEMSQHKHKHSLKNALARLIRRGLVRFDSESKTYKTKTYNPTGDGE